MDPKISIRCLPDEVIFIILKHNNFNEIANFGLTCKHYNEVINNNMSFWKNKFKCALPNIYKVAEKYGSGGGMLNDLKNFMNHKHIVFKELINMSPKHYWKIEEFTLKDVSNFFSIASMSNVTYYYTIYILQELIVKSSELMDQFCSKKPYTLTEMHYAKTVLRYLMHCYLAVKWVKDQMTREIVPEAVVIFFLQWVDAGSLYSTEDIEDILQEMTNMVKALLRETYPNQENEFTPKQIFAAISQVIFQQRRMIVTLVANLETLDIRKVWNNNFGHQTVIYAMFRAVALRCGAKCELLVFSNHLFLEWRCNDNPRSPQVFTININSGELEPIRRCPFAHNNMAQYKYNADSLLQSLYTSYVKSMGAIKSWTTTNASDLLGFLGGNYIVPSPYDHFYQYLSRHFDLMALNTDLNLKHLTEKELRLIFSLLCLNANTRCFFTKHTNKAVKISEVKKHHSSVLYAVGMICCHKQNKYVCLVRGWDLTCGTDWLSTIRADGLDYGHSQPYYHVVAVDQSERYIAQEHLLAVTNPSRLYHLEELIAKEFTHFDGFSYVLNDEKKLEYPEEGPIVEVFRQRYRNM
ncbi:F-box only protein 21-like [Battus philenor]|uniref:F-box only protein 21-like n=1 Tax=Battus philenor TaxID=42288 RepID=UPI0035D06134